MTPRSPSAGPDVRPGLSVAPRRLLLGHDPFATLDELAPPDRTVVLSSAPMTVVRRLRRRRSVGVQRGVDLSPVSDGVTVWSTTSLASDHAIEVLAAAAEVVILDVSGADPLVADFESIWLKIAAIRAPVTVCSAEADPVRRRRTATLFGAGRDLDVRGSFDVPGLAISTGDVPDRLLDRELVLVGRDRRRLRDREVRLRSRGAADVELLHDHRQRRGEAGASVVVTEGLPDSPAALVALMALVRPGGDLIIADGPQWRRLPSRSALLPDAVEAALVACATGPKHLLDVAARLVTDHGRAGGASIATVAALGLLRGRVDAVRLRGPIEHARARFEDLGSARQAHHELAAERAVDTMASPCPVCAALTDVGDTSPRVHRCPLGAR